MEYLPLISMRVLAGKLATINEKGFIDAFEVII